MGGISTKTVSGNQGLSKKEKIEQLFEKHRTAFDQLGVSNPLFIPRMFYGTPKVAKFFRSELKNGEDIFTEMVSRNYESEDPSRTLYKLKHREDYHDHYQKEPIGHNTTEVCYLIPFTEFEPVKTLEEDEVFNLFNSDEDAPFEDMSIRDYCAIVWRKPISDREWLNELINSQFQQNKK